MKKIFFIFVISIASQSFASPFRYIDDGGNINWVDRIEEVPERYKNQVIKPTPVYIPDGKGKADKQYQNALREYELKKKQAEQDRLDKEKLRIKEEMLKSRMSRQQEAQAKKQSKKSQSRGGEKDITKSVVPTPLPERVAPKTTAKKPPREMEVIN